MARHDDRRVAGRTGERNRHASQACGSNGELQCAGGERRCVREEHRRHQTSSRLFVSGFSSRRSTTQTSFNSRTTVFQTDDGGAIPPVCTARAQAWVYLLPAGDGGPLSLTCLVWRVARADSLARITGCNPAPEGSIPSRLSQRRSSDHDGMVTLGCLIHSLHRVRFTDDPLRSVPSLSVVTGHLAVRSV